MIGLVLIVSYEGSVSTISSGVLFVVKSVITGT